VIVKVTEVTDRSSWSRWDRLAHGWSGLRMVTVMGLAVLESGFCAPIGTGFLTRTIVQHAAESSRDTSLKASRTNGE
jgi:hypothetical protein